jgi:hypothetical protein
MSVVVSTYNPDERILTRVVTAVESLELGGASKIECVIVDNNSQPPVSDLRCVKTFLERCPWAGVVREPRQGMTFSRLAGFKATTAPVLVFFDDDNEPAVDYLKVARYCLDTWPCVAIWGAGRISVEFLDTVPQWFRREFRFLFNEKKLEYPEYGCVRPPRGHFYPIGMGQIIRREVAEKYTEAAESGMLTLTGRKGGSLACADDFQLVLEAVKMGFAVGLHPQLGIVHMIPRKRCTMAYAQKLAFGCASSYLPALVESLPSERAHVAVPSTWRIIMTITRITLRDLLRHRFRHVMVDLASFLGGVVGALRVTQSKRGRWVLGLTRCLKME